MFIPFSSFDVIDLLPFRIPIFLIESLRFTVFIFKTCSFFPDLKKLPLALSAQICTGCNESVFCFSASS